MFVCALVENTLVCVMLHNKHVPKTKHSSRLQNILIAANVLPHNDNLVRQKISALGNVVLC